MSKRPKGKSKNPAEGGGKATRVDLTPVEQMLAFMSQHGLEEFEYEYGGLRVRLKKPSSNANSAGLLRSAHLPEIVVASSAGGAAGASAGTLPGREEAGEAAREDLHIVKSPIVGTFYEAPNPGAEPFVKQGDQVEAGQVLCIIEAMKLMNEIESDMAGEIVRIYVENGQPVEYGESLFAIRPARKK